MHNAVDLKVFAKINLSLNIVGIEGNMHLLDSIVASINVFDAISVYARKDNLVNIMINDSSIPKENNSITKAVEAIKKRVDSFGVDIFVQKNIPIAAGLGGSSADAAGVILAIDYLLSLKERGINLREIAVETGSDSAYMLEGGYARMQGKGEKIEKIDVGAGINLVLASSLQSSFTENVYKEFDKFYPSGFYAPSDNKKIIDALRMPDCMHCETIPKNILSLIASNVGNALYGPAVALCRDIEKVYKEIEKLSPMGVFMTGSGSMVAGIYANKEEANKAVQHLLKSGFFAMCVVTQKRGFELIALR